MLMQSAEEDSNVIRIYDGRGTNTPLHEVINIHDKPVHLIAVSEDTKSLVG